MPRLIVKPVFSEDGPHEPVWMGALDEVDAALRLELRSAMVEQLHARIAQVLDAFAVEHPEAIGPLPH